MKNDTDNLFDKVNEGTFRYDAKARSFRLTGFRWRDAPALAIGLVMSVLLLTGINLAWVGLQAVLPAEGIWLLLGVSIGYFLGVWFGRRPASVQVAAQTHRLGQDLQAKVSVVGLSDSVKALADAGRKLEAVKLYMEESGVGLADAKNVLDSYIGNTNRE